MLGRKILFASAFSLLALAAQAQTNEPFRGKTITLYIGFGAGGSYDFYSRLIARHIGKYIPGKPTVIATSMPGAGSFTCANFLFAAAPKDGTAIGMITANAAVEEALKKQGVLYKSAEFNWIGRITSAVETQFTYGTSKSKTIDDATKFETVVGSTGVGSPSEGFPKILNALYGTKFKLIGPYTGTADAMLAMERGEVEGTLGSYQTIRNVRPDWVRDKMVNVLVQYSVKRTAELPNVPAVPELARTPEARKILEFYVSAEQIGRSIIAPPGVPPERVAMLRNAFTEAMKDPDLKADLEKINAEFDPMTGAELQTLVREVAKVDPDVITKIQDIIR